MSADDYSNSGEGFAFPDFQLPEGFNPSEQLMNYTSVAGESYVSFQDLDHYYKIQVNNSIILGVRIGATGLAMLALFIISRNRKTPVFILNQLCLLLVFIHSALYISYILGGYGSLTFLFTGFSELISNNNVNVSIATNFFQVLLVLLVETSLVFQVRVIFKDPNHKNYSVILTAISLAVGLSVFILYLYSFVKTTIVMLNDRVDSYTGSSIQVQPILFASSVNFMSILLIGKLIAAIRARRYLGLKQFDGFHILLIMSTQSLVIPSVILIVSYAVDDLISISFPLLAQLLVVLSLPLSAMWAASANDSSKPTSTGSYYSASYKTPNTGTSFYSGTLRNDDDFNDVNSKTGRDSINTPSTAIDEQAKKYWLDKNAENDDKEEEDDGIVHKTIHEISSDRSF